MFNLKGTLTRRFISGLILGLKMAKAKKERAKVTIKFGEIANFDALQFPTRARVSEYEQNIAKFYETGEVMRILNITAKKGTKQVTPNYSVVLSHLNSKARQLKIPVRALLMRSSDGTNVPVLVNLEKLTDSQRAQIPKRIRD